jgi:hypothetical protein
VPPSWSWSCQEALDLIQGMLNENQMERFSIGDVLNHRFLRSERNAVITSGESEGMPLWQTQGGRGVAC